MKQVLLVGGPGDGMVKTIDDGLTVLLMKVPRPFSAFGFDKPITPSCPLPSPTDRYTEVMFGEQKPLRIFKLVEMQDDDVLHTLAEFYAKGHDDLA